MGVFDLRCALSGLSTTWVNTEQGTRSGVSMLLLEELDGKWYPFVPPVSGSYGGSGSIELQEQQVNAHSRHVGARIDELFKAGTLTTESPQDLANRRKPGQKGTQLEKYLAHAGAGPFNGFSWRVHGNRVSPALFLDEVASALYSAAKLEKRSPVEEAFFANRADDGARRAYLDWLLAQGRTALAEYYRVEAERGTFGAFGAADPSASLEPFHFVVQWAVEKRGGLQPVQQSDGQPLSDEEAKALARAAWTGDEPAISRLVASIRPAWVEEWKAGGAAATAVAKESKAGKPYAATERFAIGDVITHATFGPGLVEELVPPNKLRARFGHEVKTLVHKRG